MQLRSKDNVFEQLKIDEGIKDDIFHEKNLKRFETLIKLNK